MNNHIPHLPHDAGMYQAALAYCALPPDYPRTFALRTFMPQGGSTPVTGLCRTPVALAARQGLACWTQVNDCDPATPIRKLPNSSITVQKTLTLDWEYPPRPDRALALAQDLALALIEEGLALPGQAVDDSGAGAHLLLPHTPIVTAEHGGGDLVNRAVARVVETHILPRFLQLAERHGLAGQVELGSYDIARIISLAGTWRPPHNKPDDAPFLDDGFLRRWLPPYVDGRYPVRQESKRLSALIVEAAAALRAEQAARPTPGRYRPPPGRSSDESVVDAYNGTMSARDVASLLEAHGWHVVAERAEKIIMRRPNKDKDSSGTIRWGRGIAIFYDFSTSVEQVEAHRGYSPFGVYCALEHSGNRRAAVRALAQQGYGCVVLPDGRTAPRKQPLALPPTTAQPPLTLPGAGRAERRI
jgi:hypothetical protein